MGYNFNPFTGTFDNTGISLDGSGKIPSEYLPSYIDDVIEYASFANLPVSGTTGVIYVTLDTDKVYRWSGSTYIEISQTEIPDPLTVDNLTVNTLLSASHIHGGLAGNLYIHVKNTDSVTLAKGTPFYIVGSVGASDRLEVRAAQSGDPTKGPAVGLLDSSLTVNGEGNGIIIGEIFNYNTSGPGWDTNDLLYVDTTGGLTNVRPSTGYKQPVGEVGRLHATTGSIIVNISRPIGVDDLTDYTPWNFTGAYNGGASYAVGDIATYAGETWYRIHANGGNTGDIPAEGTFWTLIAQKGADGGGGGGGSSIGGDLFLASSFV